MTGHDARGAPWWKENARAGAPVIMAVVNRSTDSFYESAATLEAALGFCAGCWAFGHLMRLGVIPEETCEACADITRRRPAVEEPVTTA